jgi:hypothetical protein
MAFGDSFVWSVNEPKLFEWLSARVQKLVPLFERTTNLAFPLSIEIAWEAVQHFIHQDIAQQLKAKLRTDFPGAFPVPVTTVHIAVESPPPKKPASGKKKDAKPVAKGIDSFFTPVKKSDRH